MAVLKDSRQRAPELVSLRFCAIVTGMNYGQVAALMLRKGIQPTVGKMRKWPDVVKGLAGRLITSRTVAMLIKYVDPTATGQAPTPIPKPAMASLRKAWEKLGVAGCDLVVEGRGILKADPALKIQSDEDDEQAESTFSKMEKAKLRIQEENLAYRRLQTQRLSGLMVDRATIRARCRAQAILVQRHLASVPAFVTGELVKIAALTDGQLRAVERALEDGIPRIIAELRRETIEMDKDAAALASSQRYGDRNWSTGSEPKQ